MTESNTDTAPIPEAPPSPTPEPPKADSKPKRPTTRAARRAQAAATKARRDAEKKAKPAKQPTSKPRKAELRTRLAGSISTVGTAVSVAGSASRSQRVQVDGLLIVKSAPDVADALDAIAKDDPRVAAALERMLTVGVWGGLVAAMTPMLVGMSVNHGILPPVVAEQLGIDLGDVAPPEPPPAPPTGVPTGTPPGANGVGLSEPVGVV